MKSLLLVLLMMICAVSEGGEWVSAGEIRPIQYFQPAPVYYYSPQIVIVPVAPPQQIQYVPVTTYTSVVVERPHWCLLKRYEVVPVANTVYLPVGVFRNY